MLVARKQLQAKLLGVGLGIRGIPRGFGLKIRAVSKAGFEARTRELVGGHPMLARIIEPMLAACQALRVQLNVLHRQMLAIAREGAVCRRLMTVPGVGPLVAVTFTSAVGDPGRLGRPKAVGAHFGLTPKKCQSGETDVTGGITRAGDVMVRAALHEAANALLSHTARLPSLNRWALGVARRRGLKRAKVALARKLAAALHRMWVDGTTFRWGREAAMAA